MKELIKWKIFKKSVEVCSRVENKVKVKEKSKKLLSFLINDHGEAISKSQTRHECSSCQQGDCSIIKEILRKENVWPPMTLVLGLASSHCHSLPFLGKTISLLAPTGRQISSLTWRKVMLIDCCWDPGCKWNSYWWQLLLWKWWEQYWLFQWWVGMNRRLRLHGHDTSPSCVQHFYFS